MEGLLRHPCALGPARKDSIIYNAVISKRNNGGRGQNRTADTGIFKASKINNLLISLKQGFFGTVWVNCFDSIG